MRHPKLMVRIMRGGAIHPHLKVFSNKNKVVNKTLPHLEDKFVNLNIHHGVGVKPDKKMRKPLKFNF